MRLAVAWSGRPDASAPLASDEMTASACPHAVAVFLLNPRPHRVFARGPVPLVAPLLIVGLSLLGR
jgi:hypothetical protein